MAGSLFDYGGAARGLATSFGGAPRRGLMQGGPGGAPGSFGGDPNRPGAFFNAQPGSNAGQGGFAGMPASGLPSSGAPAGAGYGPNPSWGGGAYGGAPLGLPSADAMPASGLPQASPMSGLPQGSPQVPGQVQALAPGQPDGPMAAMFRQLAFGGAPPTMPNAAGTGTAYPGTLPVTAQNAFDTQISRFGQAPGQSGVQDKLLYGRGLMGGR